MPNYTTNAVSVKRNTSFVLDVSLMELVRAEADRQRRSLTTCVDMALRLWLKHHEDGGEPLLDREPAEPEDTPPAAREATS